jgi:hypothetical protein
VERAKTDWTRQFEATGVACRPVERGIGKAEAISGDMSSMRLTIEVRGTEPSTIRSGETAWRMAIAQKVAERFPEPFMPPEGTEFAVDVVFHLVEHRLFVRPNRPGPPDLDNLLKPVLDTLFTSANVLGPTGVLINANDTWVTDVRARKTEVPDASQEGADITVSWSDADPQPKP